MEDNNLNKIEGEWDQYWLRSSKKKSINKIYDFFAYIYRKFLIGPSFKYYMYKHFNKKLIFYMLDAEVVRSINLL